MHVLVIDDDISVGAAIQTLLSRLGCGVVFVENGRIGIRAFEECSFDAVMIDIFMPEMDGLESIKHLRQSKSNVPIIAMSGFRFRESIGPAPDFLGMAAELGATYCLRKPFAPSELIAAIGACRRKAFPKTRATRI